MTCRVLGSSSVTQPNVFAPTSAGTLVVLLIGAGALGRSCLLCSEPSCFRRRSLRTRTVPHRNKGQPSADVLHLMCLHTAANWTECRGSRVVYDQQATLLGEPFENIVRRISFEVQYCWHGHVCVLLDESRERLGGVHTCCFSLLDEQPQLP